MKNLIEIDGNFVNPNYIVYITDIKDGYDFIYFDILFENSTKLVVSKKMGDLNRDLYVIRRNFVNEINQEEKG